MRFRFVFLLGFVSFATVAPAQDSLQTAPEPSSFFRLDVDNDALQLRGKNISDRYYSSGVRVSLLTNFWATWPTNRLLLKFGTRTDRSYARLYDFTIGQEIYTPFDKLTAVRPLYPTDRPYCGYIYLSWGLTTTDPVRGRRLSSSLTLGAIGPLSLAAESQEVIHRWIKESYPQGWATQFKNDPILSYAMQYEGRVVPRFSDYADLIGFAEGQAGSLGNWVGVGGQIRLGLFADYFTHPAGFYNRSDPRYRRKLQAYVALSMRFRGLIDNSLLQGGWFNAGDNLYALPAVEINHFYNQGDFSFGFVYRGTRLTFTQSIRTPELLGGLQHEWGSIGLTVRVGK
jgi:lipid A 3-O-deacylase